MQELWLCSHEEARHLWHRAACCCFRCLPPVLMLCFMWGPWLRSRLRSLRPARARAPEAPVLLSCLKSGPVRCTCPAVIRRVVCAVSPCWWLHSAS